MRKNATIEEIALDEVRRSLDSQFLDNIVYYTDVTEYERRTVEGSLLDETGQSDRDASRRYQGQSDASVRGEN